MSGHPHPFFSKAYQGPEDRISALAGMTLQRDAAIKRGDRLARVLFVVLGIVAGVAIIAAVIRLTP